MKKRIEVVMAVLLLLGACLFAREGAYMVDSLKAQKGEICIVVDAGHGGDDPGKIGINDVKEKEVNLKIAQELEKLLRKEGVKVVMTRKDEIITKAKPVFTVSIHQNSYPDESVKGAQVFYYGQSQEGKKLAEALQQTLVEQLDPQNHRQAKANESYFLLKKTPSPTVIVECGFLSNYEEAELLKSEAYQKKVAEAVKTGILKCLNMDGKSSNSEAMGEKIQQ